MKIIDAHHHIWRRADLPWLLGPTQPRIFGPYDGIKRDYSIGEFVEDAVPCGVTKSVYVQANWAPNWFLDEVRFVTRASEASGWPHAIAAYCNMLQEDARADLEALAAFPLVRAVRHQMHYHHNPQYRFAPGPEVVGSDTVVRNVGALADYGFAFELQVFTPQTPAALRLVDECADVTFILQHALMPEDRSEAGITRWREALQSFAARPNVVSKLSGFGTFIHRNDPVHIADIVTDALDIFGPSRCLFGSNFPIEKLWTQYAPLLSAVRDALAALPEEDQAAVLHNTAANVYRI
ncbi:MAG: amidohydrolase family protein [Pseudomonadota bacterium]